MRVVWHRLFALAAAWVGVTYAVPGQADEIDEGVRFKSVAIQGNPLGVVIGRYSADLEYLPAPHHALHLTPVGYFALPGVADQYFGYGAEVGYRWYSSADGPSGFFLGGSVLIGSFTYVHTAEPGVTVDASDNTTFAQVGGAIDAGYQLVFLGNLAVGAGVGLSYTVDTATPTFEAGNRNDDLLYGAGLRPRALLSIGAAF
jgi:hypothetical protein